MTPPLTPSFTRHSLPRSRKPIPHGVEPLWIRGPHAWRRHPHPHLVHGLHRALVSTLRKKCWLS